ncbi:MAG: hypothetical protein ABFD18_06720 [Syntrophomonas sp.]
MKDYTKPALEVIKLTVEERFATGSGTACVKTGGCGYIEDGVIHEIYYWTGLNGV